MAGERVRRCAHQAEDRLLGARWTVPPTMKEMAMSSLAAVVLAAGKGTRMRCKMPKVIQPVAGRPMILYTL